MIPLSRLTQGIRSSLALTTLLQMAVPITFILLLITGISYWHMVGTLEKNATLTLTQYSNLRVQKESAIFLQAEQNHLTFRQELLSALASSQVPDKSAYEHMIIRPNDGTSRLHPDVFEGTPRADGSTSRYISGYLGAKAPKDDLELNKRLISSYHLLDRFGPAWESIFPKLYVSFPENAHVMYWRKLPWGLMVEPNYQTPLLAKPLENSPEQTKHHWSSLTYDVTADEWQVICETPIYGYGKHLLNVGLSLPLNNLFKSLSSEKLPGAYHFLLRKNGELIAHPNKIQLLKKYGGSVPINKLEDTELSAMSQQIQKTLGSLSKSQQGINNSLIINAKEQHSIIAVSKLAGPDWLFVTVYPKHLYLASAEKTATFIFTLGGILLLIELALLFFILRHRVNIPLARFAKTAQAISKGSYQELISDTEFLPTERADEVGKLALSIQAMGKDIQEHRDTLEDEVAERTLELSNSNRRLEKLSEELRENSEAKSRFLANMSHEIRTPLTAIIGYANSVIDGEIPPQEHNKVMSIIAKNGEHLLHVINSILDLSKIEAQKLEFELRPIKLMDLIQQTTNLGQSLADKKGLVFDCRYHFPLPEVLITDSTRVQQILLNLINNAVKFTSQGSVTLTLSASASALTFRIQDTGIGMDEKQSAMVFNAFTQADGSTSRRFGGTGLGLSISKSLAQGMNGDIEVSSQPNKGSCFTLSLKLELPEQPVWLKELPTEGNLNPVTKPAKEKNLDGKILLAEDNLDNQALIALLLRHIGLDVTTANNGKEALQLAMNHDFDIILMDIQMPEMDGVQAMNMIKETGNETPIIALTANSMDHEIKNYLSAGFSDHLAKPIDKEVFISKLKYYLSL